MIKYNRSGTIASSTKTFEETCKENDIFFSWCLKTEENQRVIKEFHKSEFVNFIKFLANRRRND